MRADRDLLRRRCFFVRKRAELLAHIQNTNSQYNLPTIGRRLDRKKNREGIDEHFPIPAVRKSVEADLQLLDYFDEKKHGKGKALSIIGASLGRAVYFMLQRGEPFDREKFYVS